MTQDAKVTAALKLAIDCILDAHGMTLNVYQQIVDYLTRTGKIKVAYHCISLA